MAHASNSIENDTNNNASSPVSSPVNSASKTSRWLQNSTQEVRQIPKFIFDPDGSLICYWTAAVGLALLYNAWTIALRIAFPEIRQEGGLFYLYYLDLLSDFIYLMDIFMQLRTAYLEDGIPVFKPTLIRKQYMSHTYFVQDVISVIPSQTILSLLPDAAGWCKYFLCTAGAARLTKLLKFHILYKFYDLAESFTSNPHLIRVLRLFLNLAIIIHWIACLYYLLSEYEGLGSNEWVYTNSTDQQRFSRKYIICLYWSAMTLTTIGNTNSPETDVEYIFTGVIFMTGVFVFATVMGNVGDVISSMNANRQEFQARMDHIQMYLTHKKVPASLQLKIKKWAEYTWSRTKATDESRLLNMLPERLRAEVAVHVHLDSLKKVKIFEQCETGFLCELVLKLRSQVFSPGDYVCRVGETGREMFIINHGKVEVLVPSPATNKDMVVAMLSEGNYFGEISLLRLDGAQNRRTADVRSIGYSELLCLSRRDLMAALVEYPEAKSILEGQAKKRMKTNLQAQRTFSVDKLLRNSQEYSSTDSGITSRDDRGEVSEIKAMIQELKNANKVPSRTVWQLIARCEVLQAKLGEKEKEIDDSKQRIKDLEQLLFSRHAPQNGCVSQGDQIETTTSSIAKALRPNNKVTKQYSQDEGRSSGKELSNNYQKERCLVKNYKNDASRIIPDLKVTRPSETSDDELVESDRCHNYNNDSSIKTSKITNVCSAKFKDGDNLETKNNSENGKNRSFSNTLTKKVRISEQDEVVSPDGYTFAARRVENGSKAYKMGQKTSVGRINKQEANNIYSQNIQSSHSSDDGSYIAETSIDHQVFFNDNDHMSFTASFKNEFSIYDSFNFNTIPEENEEIIDDTFEPLVSNTYANTYRNVNEPVAVDNDEELPSCYACGEFDSELDSNMNEPPLAKPSYTDLDPVEDRCPNKPQHEPSPNSIYRDLDPSDLEIKSVRPRFVRSASASGGLYQYGKGKNVGVKKPCSLDDANLADCDSDSGINFRRLGSMSSFNSDESGSRRNSWNFDSELEEESDNEISS